MTARELALRVVRDVFPEAPGVTERTAHAAFDYHVRRSHLSERDVAFAAELAYGAIKMRRALDWYLAFDDAQVEKLRQHGLTAGPDCTPAVVRAAKLLLLKLGKQQRILAGLGQFGEVLLHAGLDTAAAGLDVRASFLSVGLADLGYRHVA